MKTNAAGEYARTRYCKFLSVGLKIVVGIETT